MGALMLGTLQKRPNDQLDYEIDFEKWLNDDDKITSAVADVTKDGVATDELTVQSASVSESSPTLTVWLSGGVDGVTYTVTVTVATTGGRIKEEDFKIRVRD